MPGLTSFRKTNAGNALKTLGASLLLLCYLAGNIGSGIVHEFFHPRLTSVSHSPAQEKDVCHRAIYHFGKDPKHNSHFAISDKEDKCHVLAHTEQALVSNPSCDSLQPDRTRAETLTALHIAGISILLPSRAPPVV